MDPGALWRSWRFATALTVVWLLLVGVYTAGFFLGTADAPRASVFEVVLMAMAALLPVILIWALVGLARLIAPQDLRFDRIETGMETLYAEIQALKAVPGPDLGGVEARLEDLSTQIAAMRDAATAPPTMEEPVRAEPAPPPVETAPPPPRTAPPQPAGGAAMARSLARNVAGSVAIKPDSTQEGGAAAEQPDIPSEPEPEPDNAPYDGALSVADTIRALDFPSDGNDRTGFAALKRALEIPHLAQLLQAAEDVLNVMAEKGFYIDDLPFEPAPPALWRRYAAGERGDAFVRIGGVMAPQAQGAMAEHTRADQVFRDTCLHFERRFDVVLGPFARTVDDGALTAFVGTRTGRAYQLIGSISGRFGDAPEDDRPDPASDD